MAGPSEVKTPRPRGRPPRLSSPLVIETAVKVVRENGLRNLSMRALAERLGATPMAFHHHVGDREALVGRVVEHIFEQLALPDDRLAPLDWLREVAMRVRGLGLEHRGVMDFLLEEGPAVHGALVVLDRTVTKLHEAGMPWREAGDLNTTFFSWLAGTIRRQEPWAARRKDAPLPLQRFHTAALALPAQDHPGVSQTLARMRTLDVEAEFQNSLDFMLEGIGRRLEQHRAGRPRGP
ncbi:TetR/AcrR family transcriptional regulator [Myxococcus sp. K38C18041901]|uniref:TetR/AcrR family transcriptional regulator n=1 Tax=Myxococcus guangdongensis TaxID=2906760 RepID=UPI0020A7CEDA|nr:TetR/AcrR family transcriptional regulator [Myxococcus guangdongensis]MCP3063817.1 TetR/AcrR family transcriptional regulator [Myxococcus guangdongensis]